jgi:hypothetical protein
MVVECAAEVPLSAKLVGERRMALGIGTGRLGSHACVPSFTLSPTSIVSGSGAAEEKASAATLQIHGEWNGCSIGAQNPTVTARSHETQSGTAWAQNGHKPGTKQKATLVGGLHFAANSLI